MIKDLKRFVRVAQGLEPAELVIKNARVFRSLLGDFVDADIAIDQGHIAGIGEYEGRDYVYADGRYAIPGFIDGHVHRVGDFLGGGQSVERLLQACGLLFDFVDDAHLIQGQTYDTRLVGDGLQDGLAYPPNRVGDELETARFVKTLRRLDQSQVTLVDEVL